MASSAAYLSTAYVLPWKNSSKLYQSFQVRAHSYRDEGRSSNIVDENLVVLRERMKEVKNKERLERCCLAEAAVGWYYNAPLKNNCRNKREEEFAEFVETAGVVAATFGLTILSCSCCLCMLALLVHLN